MVKYFVEEIKVDTTLYDQVITLLQPIIFVMLSL